MAPKSFLLAVVLLLAACMAVAAAPADLPECVRHAAFAGITPTDNAGNLTGTPDASDWGCIGGGSSSVTGVSPPPVTRICLDPAWPNPATQSTSLRFTLPRTTTVSLIVYGQHGRRGRAFPVRTLVSGNFPAGVHVVVWDLKDDQGVRLSPDLYRAVIQVDGQEVCGDIDVR